MVGRQRQCCVLPSRVAIFKHMTPTLIMHHQLVWTEAHTPSCTDSVLYHCASQSHDFCCCLCYVLFHPGILHRPELLTLWQFQPLTKKFLKNNPPGLYVLWEYVDLETPVEIFTLGKDKIYFKSINIVINFKHVLKYHTHWTLNHIWTCNDDANIL